MRRGLIILLLVVPAAAGFASLCSAQLLGSRTEATSCAAAIGGNVSGTTISVVCGIPAEILDKLVRARTELLEEVVSANRETISLLKQTLNLNERQIRAALDILGEKDIPPEQLAAKLVEIAERYKELLAFAAGQPGDTPAIAALKAEAQKAIDAGELAKADELFAAVETEQRQALDHITVNTAETAARRGDIAMTRLRYREAAEHFAKAAALFAPDGRHEKRRIRYLEKEAGALRKQGDDFGEKEALRAAVERYCALIALKPRNRVPFKWAGGQYELGVTLMRLGERDSGTAQLEEALAAFAEAQKELTREAKPRRWARIESTRGYVLGVIGVRQRGTTRLDEAVASYREVLKVVKREQEPHQWAWAQMNLGVALARRGERSHGTRRLEAAVAAYRRALEEYTREKDPFRWASIQNNLGTALNDLGTREGGTARSQEAIAAYHEALKEWTLERLPMRRAGAQTGIANVLVRVARHESGTARLEEAIAIYDEALKERSRERTPIDWARTSGRQAIALMLLAERTNNAEMAEHAVARIEGVLDTVRGGGHAPREDYFERQLPLARALVQRLRQP